MFIIVIKVDLLDSPVLLGDNYIQNSNPLKNLLEKYLQAYEVFNLKYKLPERLRPIVINVPT